MPKRRSPISDLQSFLSSSFFLLVLLTACVSPTSIVAPSTPTASPLPTLVVVTPIPPSPTPLPSPTPGPVTFTLALPAAPGTLDPANAADSSALLITRHLYEGLTRFEPGTTRVLPALAESWETTGAITWTFRLRTGVTFSDGTPLTAELAARNFERWQTRTPPGNYAYFRLMFGGFAGQTDETGAPLSNLKVITATSPVSLTLVLNRPDATLPNTLAMPSFALVNPTAFTPGPSLGGRRGAFGTPGAPSAGTGPFVLKAWRENLIELERNPNYWGTPASPDGLIFKIIPDAVQRLTALQVGEVDGLAALSPQHYNVAESWPIRVEFSPPLPVLYLGFNQARAPWNNLDCRLAVAHALDRDRYVREFFPGDAERADTLQPDATLTETWTPDVEKARALWEGCTRTERGRPHLNLNLYVPPIARDYAPDPAGLGAAIQADLAAAGITVTVQSPDWTTQYLPDVQAGRADLFLLGWFAPNGDPDGSLCPLFCGRNAAFNSDNTGLPLPPDETLAQLLRQARAATDPVLREALYAQAHRRIFETVPAIPIAKRKTAWAFRNDLTGAVLGPLEAVFFGLKLTR
ncbi:MAG: ABC transporter substrate-binding protein [Anaerolineales bacterium]|nr:ABC transporter substrate-binding protein [Anaerolineales bacterium]